MCEYCYRVACHHPQCPLASEPEIRGHCKQCGEELREDCEYYTDNENNEFCSEDCAMGYHGIKSKEWNNKEE